VHCVKANTPRYRYECALWTRRHRTPTSKLPIGFGPENPAPRSVHEATIYRLAAAL
jgi:hypothetical protein